MRIKKKVGSFCRSPRLGGVAKHAILEAWRAAWGRGLARILGAWLVFVSQYKSLLRFSGGGCVCVKAIPRTACCCQKERGGETEKER
jgi:hypothetical protein